MLQLDSAVTAYCMFFILKYSTFKKFLFRPCCIVKCFFLSEMRFYFKILINRNSSGIGLRGRTDVPKDPRPITDRSYINRMIKMLCEVIFVDIYSLLFVDSESVGPKHF